MGFGFWVLGLVGRGGEGEKGERGERKRERSYTRLRLQIGFRWPAGRFGSDATEGSSPVGAHKSSNQLQFTLFISLMPVGKIATAVEINGL